MALFRALETTHAPSDRLIEDRFAAGFLPPALRAVLELSRVPLLGTLVPWIIDRWWPGPRGAGIVRTRFIDDALRTALAAGARQVVILGAGFDSRAYRIPGAEHARVFEVDHPATQAVKRTRLARRLGRVPGHVAFVPVDFTRDALSERLGESGFAKTARTFVIWEGVTNYLTAEAVDATFRALAGLLAPGSAVLFTYIDRGILDGSKHFAGADESIATVQRVGEPFTFGFEPAELPGYLGARGFVLVEDVGAREYRTRYLAPAGRKMKLSEFYRAALARRGSPA